MARRVEVTILGNSRGLERAFSQSAKSADGFNRKLKLAGGAAVGFGKVVGAGLAVGGGAAGGLGVKFVKLAGDAGEVSSKFKVVFGREVPALNKEIRKFSEATGASRFEMRQQVADMGALLSPMLKNRAATADMSVAVTELASDLGSFNNVPTPEALEALRAGIVGEYEPMRRFGVVLSEARVQQEAFRITGKKTAEQLTNAEKVQARFNLIMRDTKQAQGDATRTSGSFANQLKRLKNQARDTATDLGKKLLPAATSLLRFGNRFLAAKGFQAKMKVAWVGIGKARDALRQKLGELVSRIDWDAVWARARRITEGLQAQLGRAISNIDWDSVWGQAQSFSSSLADKVKDGFGLVDWASVGAKINEAFLQVDWGAVGTTIGSKLLTGLDFGAGLVVKLADSVAKHRTLARSCSSRLSTRSWIPGSGSATGTSCSRSRCRY